VTAPEGSPVVEGDVRLIHDPSPFEGPLIGLAAGLAAAREASVFLTAGDIPGLVPGVVELLLGALDDPAVEIAVLADDDAPQPFPMAMRRDVARTTTARLVGSGERRLFSLIEDLACAVIEAPVWRAVDPDGRSIRDIDTPADLP
jgi:molybdopterin-guanine dinucleotide biosynthesis protein A